MATYHNVHLPKPVNTIEYFEVIKSKSEKLWNEIKPDRSITGLQVQPKSKWKKGLTEEEIAEFEKVMGFIFPPALRNFYLTMNGLNKPAINYYSDSGLDPVLQPMFFSLPEDIELIKENIDWIYSSNKTDPNKLKKIKASRIFPVINNRFMLIDEPGHPILSMVSKDIIYWSDTLAKAIAIELFNDIENDHDFLNMSEKKRWIKFWQEK